MVQIQSLGPAASGGNKIVGVNVVFPSGKTQTFELTEWECKQLLKKYPDKYVEFKNTDGEIQRLYFDYYKYPDGNYGFICSELPIEAGWWKKE